MRQFIFLLFLLLAISGIAQDDFSSALRGVVIDKQSQFPLPGAQIIVVDLPAGKGTASDVDGRYRIDNIPPGRHNIEVRMIGYENQTISAILFYSHKDVELNFQLIEKVTETEAVEVIGIENKADAINKMSSVSTRSFSMEEARRYSGTLQDPARMAQNFAGVSNASDDRNDIIIRGNSPTGVLWRLDGIDIPSPNHFSTLGTTGGPVSMLNANNLATSDFATSAFPAEYGNALSGVFDLKLRTGNKDKREFLGQIGFNGFEAGMEGPFVKGKSASYMINYRYSFLGALKSLGVNFGTGSAIPEYQDITYKIDLPTKKFGRFAFFGIAGKSYINFKFKPEENNLYNIGRQNSEFQSRTGVFGFSHQYFIKDNTLSKLIIAFSGTNNGGHVDSLNLDGQAFRNFGIDRTQNKWSLHYSINTKFNARHTLRYGTIAEQYQVATVDSVLLQKSFFFKNSDYHGYVKLAQLYAQWLYRPAEKWTINTGLHGQYFLYNNKMVVEPRLGARYAIRPGRSLNFGAGLHSQLQPVTVYFNRERETDGSVIANNKNLGFNRAAHAVLGYDWQWSKSWRLKTEAYYQYLFDVAVDQRPTSFSMLNVGADFTIPNNANLVNKGLGQNYGLEITVERFLDRGFYCLFTSSLFESRYRGSDQVWRNTAFNGNYVFNALAGKEWKIGENNAFTLDLKTTYAGGRWHAPINFDQSRASGYEVRDRTRDFSEQYPAYFRVDVKAGIRLNSKKYAQAFSLDIRNVTNHQNIFLQQFNPNTGGLATTFQTGFFPMVLYNIWF